MEKVLLVWAIINHAFPHILNNQTCKTKVLKWLHRKTIRKIV